MLGLGPQEKPLSLWGLGKNRTLTGSDQTVLSPVGGPAKPVRTHSLSKSTNGAMSGGTQGFPEEGKETGD